MAGVRSYQNKRQRIYSNSFQERAKTRMTETEKKLEYDRYGRLKYNPAYHINQGKPWTTKENIYLCKYYTCENVRSKKGVKVSNIKTLSLDMGRTEVSIKQQLRALRAAGLYDIYKHWGDQ